MNEHQQMTKEIVLKLIEHGVIKTDLECTKAFRHVFTTIIESERVELKTDKISTASYWLDS